MEPLPTASRARTALVAVRPVDEDLGAHLADADAGMTVILRWRHQPKLAESFHGIDQAPLGLSLTGAVLLSLLRGQRDTDCNTSERA